MSNPEFPHLEGGKIERLRCGRCHAELNMFIRKDAVDIGCPSCGNISPVTQWSPVLTTVHYVKHALDAADRKRRPLASGVLDYFPDALMEVAYCSYVGNEQHNPDEPLHWAKEKSTDEADALMRHMRDRGTLDTDGVRHSAKVAWRALAMLQREIDAEKA